MPAGTFERDAVAVRANTTVYDTVRITAINSNQRIDSGGAFAKQVFDTAQITETLLADVADEENIGFSLDIGMLHRPKHTQYHYKTTRIVTDAWRTQYVTINSNRNIGTRREHGIQMRRVGNDAIAGSARASTNHVTDSVDRDVGQTGFSKQFCEAHGTHALSERRRWNLGKLDEVPVRPRFNRDDMSNSSLYFLVRLEVGDFLLILRGDSILWFFTLA
jgi:hypothetical protein